ncbi:hypothetical protein BDN72DRAFT_964018 [Pluteus cervinus]|uniref:Uncharacterized protein n=1 Tax=Pluteus cervinus TaxID=181527 RepID=A0ACD3AC53_9AGAR|nr:hypothetical protein BDN72DRAFT_964018 [Pluteus cervinus]
MHFPSCLLAEHVFPRLSARQLVRFSQTDKFNYASVSDYSTYAFSITKTLGHYFTPDQITAFRILQAQTGAIISGSTALQFFDRTYYPESDLDLYVTDEDAEPLIDWIMGIGYNPQAPINRPGKDEPQSKCTAKGHIESCQCSVTIGTFTDPKFAEYGPLASEIVGVYTFLKTFGGRERKVQVVTAIDSPCEVMLRFHSTCVMNIITHSTAYSLFPLATFESRQSLYNHWSAAENQLNVNAALEKYRRRGWEQLKSQTLISSPQREDPKSDFYSPARYRYSDEIEDIRFVGDKRCWTMSLYPKVAQANQDLLAYSSSWRLEVDAADSVMTFNLLMSPALDNQYVVAEALVPFLEPIVKKLEREHKKKCDGRFQAFLRAYLELVRD